jgi:MATE family multidrug resistance protein
MYVPISLILLQSESILIFLNQDAEVAKYTSEYIRAYLPGMILMAFIDGQRRFLNMMNLTKGPLIAIIISVCFHVYLSWYFVWNLNYGIIGTGYVSTITNASNYIFLIIISVCNSDIWYDVLIDQDQKMNLFL